MANSSLDVLPEAFVSDRVLYSTVSRALLKGKLRRIRSRLYMRNLTELPEVIGRLSHWQLVGADVPEALVAERTALQNAPATDGSIFLVGARKRNIELPVVIPRPRLTRTGRLGG